MLEYLESLPLVDHHCHGVLDRDLGRETFEESLTEAETAGPPGVSMFDTQVGFALRRWCPPVLGLDAHAEPDAYLERRAELGAAEVNRRFLRAARLEALCVDAGHGPGGVLGPPGPARTRRLPGRRSHHGAWTAGDAERVAALIASGNARRVYGI